MASHNAYFPMAVCHTYTVLSSGSVEGTHTLEGSIAVSAFSDLPMVTWPCHHVKSFKGWPCPGPAVLPYKICNKPSSQTRCKGHLLMSKGMIVPKFRIKRLVPSMQWTALHVSDQLLTRDHSQDVQLLVG